MTILMRAALMLCSASMTSCMNRPASGVNYNLPVLNPQDQPCVKHVVLTGCDDQKPPKCKSAKIVYHLGCEQLEAK